MSRQVHHCSAYGLHIRSEIPLPFGSAAREAEPDVTIRIGATPEALAPSADRFGPWQTVPGVYLLRAEGVARYLVTGGREIVVQPTGGSDATGLPDYLVGSVLAACLQQRGIATLHASAIATGAGAVLFAGRSGSGKSTLLAAFLDRGYPMLADDVTGVVLDSGGRPTALAAFPCVRLCADAVDRLAWQARTRGPAPAAVNKRRFAPVEFRAEPLAVAAIFVLSPHTRAELEITPAPLAQAFWVLLQHTYRLKSLLGLEERRGQHFRTVEALARRVPVLSIRRPVHPFLLDRLADEVERRLRPGGTTDADSPPVPVPPAPVARALPIG